MSHRPLGIEQISQFFHVVPIGSRENNRQRNAFTCGQQMAFEPDLPRSVGLAVALI